AEAGPDGGRAAAGFVETDVPGRSAIDARAAVDAELNLAFAPIPTPPKRSGVAHVERKGRKLAEAGDRPRDGDVDDCPHEEEEHDQDHRPAPTLHRSILGARASASAALGARP